MPINRQRTITAGSFLCLGICAMLVCFLQLRHICGKGNEQTASAGMNFRQEKLAPYTIKNPADADNPGISAAADNSVIPFSLIDALQFVQDAPNLAAEFFCHESGKKSYRIPAQLEPLLSQEGTDSQKVLAVKSRTGEDALDISGKPVRWLLRENSLWAYDNFRVLPYAVGPGWQELDVELPDIPASGRAGLYHDLAVTFAKRYNLSAELVLAIIHCESDFRAALVSSKSAAGLMQVMPLTASEVVHKYLYGQPGKVSLADLSIPETNIHYGTTYLHILSRYYFRHVVHNDVRETCIIAAYNLGPNRFLGLYGANSAEAVQTINSMTPVEFHEDLYRRLPTLETRIFVYKVRKMKDRYSMIR